MALQWGHININVTALERSIAFYKLFGFGVFIPGIPYLGLTMESKAIDEETLSLLDLPAGTRGRACIMSLDNTFPKIDLTELTLPTDSAAPLTNRDVGAVRICLGSQSLADDVARLTDAGVEFTSKPVTTRGGLAEVALCRDPDGTLIELIQPDLEKWAAL